MLARTVRAIENSAERGKVNPANRTRFRVVAVLVREERARIKGDKDLSDAERTKELTRLDGIATIMAKTAARDTTLIQLLTDSAPLTPAALEMRRSMLMEAGGELTPDDLIVVTEAPAKPVVEERQVVPQSVKQFQMSNPFLAPDFSAVERPGLARQPPGQLGADRTAVPLVRGRGRRRGQHGAARGPLARDAGRHRVDAPPGPLHREARAGHRSYLLADEPGLGKTAQALLAANVTGSYPLLVVVPNVVKVNWAREVEKWTPQRASTVVHGDGDNIDAFADVVIVNYEVLDRHVAWLSRRGFKGMVVDEAHFIKNKDSQRSKNVQALSKSIRAVTPKALMIALTGTPLINQIEDFRMIWQFLGWIDEKKPLPELMMRLEETELDPGDPGFFRAARDAVVDMGIVRRKKVDVAADIPARRVADIPVELDGEAGRSIREAEAALVARLVERYRRVLATRPESDPDDLIRLVAAAELEETRQAGGDNSGDNVFTMVRKIGQAKATPAADYTVNLARNVGKVVFFAKHIDVMDQAEKHFAAAGLKTVSLRGDQTHEGQAVGDRRVHQRSGCRGRGLLADRRRRRGQPAGRVERRSGRAELDERRADAGHRPGPPDRAGAAGDGVAHHRGRHARRAHLAAHRREGRPRGARPRRRDRAGCGRGLCAARSAGRGVDRRGRSELLIARTRVRIGTRSRDGVMNSSQTLNYLARLDGLPGRPG